MILSRVALYPHERLDIPDARAIEALGQNDWIYFIKGIISDSSLVISGFEVTNYANIFTVPGVKLSQNDVALVHPEATTQAAGFYVSSGSEPDYSLVLSSSTGGPTTNYVEATLDVSTGSPDTRAFWDSGANGGAGAEYTDIVDTVINLELSIDVNVSGFTSGRIPLYKIVTNPDGTVNSITDCRKMYFRLGTGGTSPDPDATASFPNFPDASHARLETPVTATAATSSNAPFQGGDKNIKNEKMWKDWVMTLIKESNGTPYWYIKPTTSMAGVYQNASLTFIKGGIFYHGYASTVASSTATQVTLVNDGGFATGGGSFNIGPSVFTYTSYNPVTQKFFGVSPDPTTDAIPGAVVFQSDTGILALPDGSNIIRLGQSDSTLQPFTGIDLNTHPSLWILLSTDGSIASYDMGDDGETPIVPQDITAVTSSSITVSTGGNYLASGGSLLIKGQAFSYTAYNSGTGLFTGVSPDPSGYASIGDTVYQESSGGNGYYHISSTARVPGRVGSVSEGVERVFWLAYFDGVQTIFIRDSELVPGESAAAGNDDSQQLYDYIGSNGAADNFPVYGVSSIPDGTNLTEAIASAYEILESPLYDELVRDTMLTGWSSGADIFLPNNSRNGNAAQTYIIGSGQLEVYVNGIFWDAGDDYTESANNKITLLRDITPGSKVKFRITRYAV